MKDVYMRRRPLKTPAIAGTATGPASLASKAAPSETVKVVLECLGFGGCDRPAIRVLKLRVPQYPDQADACGFSQR